MFSYKHCFNSALQGLKHAKSRYRFYGFNKIEIHSD